MIGRIIAFEPVRAKANPVVFLGYALLAVYVTVTLAYLGRNASALQDAAGTDRWNRLRELISRSDADPALQALLYETAPVPAFFAALTFGLIPFFIMLIAADQLGGEIRQQSIRFILPRVSRRLLFPARVVAGWLLLWPALLVLVLLGWGVIASVAAASEPVLFLRLFVGLIIYAAPFVALMCFLNTFIPNGFLSFLTALGLWIVVAALSTVGAWVDPAWGYVEFLMPTSVKYALMSPDPLRWLGGVLGSLGYTVAFALAGAWLFEWRDL